LVANFESGHLHVNSAGTANESLVIDESELANSPQNDLCPIYGLHVVDIDVLFTNHFCRILADASVDVTRTAIQAPNLQDHASHWPVESL
jgi:hypothetical protein